MNDIIDFFRRLLGMGSTTTPPDTSDPCNAHACVDAKARLNAARISFVNICTVLNALRAILRAAQQVISINIWGIIGLMAFLALLGLIGFGWVSAIVIGIYAAAWIAIFAFGPAIGNLAKALIEEEKKFSIALDDVVKQCPEHCRGDVSAPKCA